MCNRHPLNLSVIVSFLPSEGLSDAGGGGGGGGGGGAGSAAVAARRRRPFGSFRARLRPPAPLRSHRAPSERRATAGQRLIYIISLGVCNLWLVAGAAV